MVDNTIAAHWFNLCLVLLSSLFSKVRFSLFVSVATLSLFPSSLSFSAQNTINITIHLFGVVLILGFPEQTFFVCPLRDQETCYEGLAPPPSVRGSDVVEEHDVFYTLLLSSNIVHQQSVLIPQPISNNI